MGGCQTVELADVAAGDKTEEATVSGDWQRAQLRFGHTLLDGHDLFVGAGWRDVVGHDVGHQYVRTTLIEGAQQLHLGQNANQSAAIADGEIGLKTA